MSFTRTSEGRVFFQNADNDDLPKKPVKNAPGVTEPVTPRDNTQMQILMLLKTLNTKLKSSKEDQKNLKKEISDYKNTIKILEKKTSTQESNYIDLEQKLSRRQSEVSKKADRVESSVKKTLDQIAQAKSLVEALEEKASTYDSSIENIKTLSKKQTLTLSTLKDEITSQKKRDAKIIEKQEELEKAQAEQGEKMVNNVAAYVALTKRVSDSEAKHEALDNKIEEARSDYIKLDRKIDKAIEDRNRILRKVERIEQAVLETRDALNAKAMVLLTDQGAVAGVHMPQISDETLKTDPETLNRRLQEEALLPAWRRPLRIQGTSLAMLIIIVLLIGWIANGAYISTTSTNGNKQRAVPPTISLDVPYSSDVQKETVNTARVEQSYDSFDDASIDARTQQYEDVDYQSVYSPSTSDIEDMSQADQQKQSQNTQHTSEHGITIHKGYSDPSEINKQSPQAVGAQENVTIEDKAIDLGDHEQLSRAFEETPEQLAAQLNAIEPGEINAPTAPDNAVQTASLDAAQAMGRTLNDNQAYVESLKRRITPDNNLSDIAKKIETQAFQGIPEAQHDMGALYVAGHGQVKQDLERAIFWFTEASQNGIANAKYNLGVLNHQGMGTQQNIDRAMALYKDAADIGHPEAQYNLGIANIEGIGVSYNPSQAAYYFEKAAQQGVIEAAYNLGLIYENGLLGQPQPEEALTWYKKAADAGSPEAQSALEQLASSLGIKVEDVKRIVDKVQARQSDDVKNTLNTQNNYLISEIQSELMRRGLYPGPVDGMIGPMTKQAIESFQKAANMRVNGMPSNELLSYLRATSKYSQ